MEILVIMLSMFALGLLVFFLNMRAKNARRRAEKETREKLARERWKPFLDREIADSTFLPPVRKSPKYEIVRHGGPYNPCCEIALSSEDYPPRETQFRHETDETPELDLSTLVLAAELAVDVFKALPETSEAREPESSFEGGGGSFGGGGATGSWDDDSTSSDDSSFDSGDSND